MPASLSVPCPAAESPVSSSSCFCFCSCFSPFSSSFPQFVLTLLGSLQRRRTHHHCTPPSGTLTCFDIATPTHTHTAHSLPLIASCRRRSSLRPHGIITRPLRTQNCAKFGEPRVAQSCGELNSQTLNPTTQAASTFPRYPLTGAPATRIAPARTTQILLMCPAQPHCVIKGCSMSLPASPSPSASPPPFPFPISMPRLPVCFKGNPVMSVLRTTGLFYNFELRKCPSHRFRSH